MQYLFIVQLLLIIAGPVVKFVLKMLGFGFVTYFGINLLLSEVQSYLISSFGQSGVAVQQILGLAKIDVAISIYLSAVSTRLILTGLNRASDLRREQVWRAPTGGMGGGGSGGSGWNPDWNM